MVFPQENHPYNPSGVTSKAETALGEMNGRRAAFVAGALAGDATLGVGTLRGGENREIDLYELRGCNERCEGLDPLPQH